MGEIGNRLREARENRGLTLEQAEDATRIRRVFLQALEEEQFEKLPADVYARGFLGNYARFLGLDPEPLLKSYRSPHTKQAIRLPTVLDEPLRKSTARNIGAALFWGLVVVVILGLGLWYGYQEFYLGTTWGPRPTPSAIPVETLPVATATPNLVVAESQPTVTPMATPEPRQPVATARRGVAPSPTAKGALTKTRTAALTSAGVSSSSTRGSPTAANMATTTRTRPTLSLDDGVPIVIHISDKTYVNVVVDGAKVMEAILERGDDQSWAFKRTFAMRVGNAGGVQVTLNGVDLPALGKAGEVLTVEYMADNLPSN